MSSLPPTENANEEIVGGTAKQMRFRNKNEMNWRVIRESIPYGAATTVAALGLSAVAQKRWPFYQRLTLPIKVSVILGSTIIGFFTASDIVAMKIDREFAQQFSVVRESEVETDASQGQINFTTAEGWKNAFVRFRYSAVAGLWATSMAVALGYNFRRTDITHAQKVINARMTAQLLALAGVMGVAGVSAMVDIKPMVKIDPYYERIVAGGSKPATS
ncbi:uncharacterized protein BJ171DRAFT_472278 [Polychytrium aggregatum]|uniref:uncharacterized protein n=1 Tax=Polychytrium aggregatum TaxID=110093 RepID=UPI0022FF2C69|nr:uncharacterized protein BJ171DRAFT_258763 [Polychytrium aggregatum]XP_052970075.1 uncharacterized protein BJ171DRAFT_472278 [Polychytrium aggregatum]KAI9207965.1 hypothetical protein BJ171DRAFT_258763 [Polychytrium aggregatum]KAI9207995.1 hypothetical protein BJ171DRAFT_472278 [Polychytrium aggregatum]